MTELIDDYLRKVDASLRVEPSRRRQIVDEMRTHLIEKVEDEQRAAPERPRIEVEQTVLRGFGNPRDLALAYDSDGSAVLTGAAGDILLRLGEGVGRGAAAVARGTGRMLKWTAVGLAITLVLALGVGGWAFYQVKPHLPAILDSASPVYVYSERCGTTPCNGTPVPASFDVGPDATTVRFDLRVSSIHPYGGDQHVGNGSVRVVVTDPLGAVRLDRTFDLRDDGDAYQHVRWTAEPGPWTVAYTFVDFEGSVRVDSHAVRMPFGAE